jgi:hypothetical protein
MVGRLTKSGHFGPDLLLFNEGDTSGVYTHELYLASVAVVDRMLSDTEVAAGGDSETNSSQKRLFSEE